MGYSQELDKSMNLIGRCLLPDQPMAVAGCRISPW